MNDRYSGSLHHNWKHDEESSQRRPTLQGRPADLSRHALKFDAWEHVRVASALKPIRTRTLFDYCLPSGELLYQKCRYDAVPQRWGGCAQEEVCRAPAKGSRGIQCLLRTKTMP